MYMKNKITNTVLHTVYQHTS